MKINQLLRQAQQAQQNLQEQLSRLEVEGRAGGGLVTVRLNGLKELLGVSFAPEALTQADAELLAEMVKVAWEEAARAVEGQAKALLARMGLPGGLW
ncbi:MAG: YbaB/EbfC family nucleoid-associated protein [Thermoanaerobaculum sp.]|nr:YbaB/EbfC family nucleoid-associated protein [Thermoanaerobaculum sp.]MCX7894366.1 YbaB/EbfC family nucleoid-associated protein [Thermoanaerobaculum sp.]MDW7968093.1 YbaB/EbfC family nucleoid-associated protein [Thermoanaerobaculum sp.]